MKSRQLNPCPSCGGEFDEIKGKRVTIIGKKHPHFSESGTVEDYKMTAMGKAGLIIKLDDWTSCFVFDIAELRFHDRLGGRI